MDATAYDLMLRSIPLMDRLEREAFMQAGEYLSRAIELEPEYAAAHAWYAYWQMFLVGQDWADDPAAAMEAAGQHAERAVALDPYDARGLTIAGHVRAFLYRRQHEAIALHERALSLNPNLAMAWAFSAIAHAYAGDPEEAERRNNRYKKLSPLDPHAFFFDAFFILIHLLKRDYKSAVAVARTVTEMNPSFAATYKPYLVGAGPSRAQLRRQRWCAGGLLAIEPDFTVERFIASVAARARERPRALRARAAPRRSAGACRRDCQAVAGPGRARRGLRLPERDGERPRRSREGVPPAKPEVSSRQHAERVAPMTFQAFRFDPVELPPVAKALRKDVRAFLDENRASLGNRRDYDQAFSRRMAERAGSA